MDTTVLLSQQADVQNQITSAETGIETLKSQLATINEELATASLVNGLEALTPDQVALINTSLQEPSNTTGISLSIPSTAAQV